MKQKLLVENIQLRFETKKRSLETLKWDLKQNLFGIRKIGFNLQILILKVHF